MFGKSLSLKPLSLLCRSLSTLLDTGVSARKAFQISGEKAADSSVRTATRQIAQEIEKGMDIATALKDQDLFPPLMVNMVDVGERTGSLPEVLKGLAEHYDNLLRLRKDFYSSIAWPVIQLVMAVFVIAGLIFLLGWIAESRGGDPIDILGWGLTGTEGALIWLGMVFGTAIILFLAYRFARASIFGQSYLDGFLMRVPVLGHCMRSFAIARFAWAYHLTQESGMAIQESIDAATRATSNGQFILMGPRISQWIEQGDTVTEALRASNLFPLEVIEMIHVGETAGTVPEMLHRLGPEFEDRARRSLQALAGAIGWLVWLIVAGFIIFVVFSIFFWYIQQINSLL
ncbi:MAG: type II secretion system F family protein [Planctomycetaceae bacterium]|nr:type II secretion system F family protein [Planctomycetaceae bacterium]